MSDPVVATFNPGDAEATVSIPLINDGVDENTEFFRLVLTLGNNTNIEGRSCVRLGMENTGIIGTILDDGMYICMYACMYTYVTYIKLLLAAVIINMHSITKKPHDKGQSLRTHMYCNAYNFKLQTLHLLLVSYAHSIFTKIPYTYTILLHILITVKLKPIVFYHMLHNACTHLGLRQLCWHNRMAKHQA